MEVSADDAERYDCCKTPLDLLKNPLTFPVAKNLIARNRLTKAPMMEELATYNPKIVEKCGLPTELLFHMTQKFCAGGCGMIVTGCIESTDGLVANPGDALIAKAIDSPERRQLFQQYAKCANGSLIIGQIIHPGQRSTRLVDQKYVPYDMNKLTTTEIRQVIEQHVYGARYLYEAGFHGVELNASLSFALGQMVDASQNVRTDVYGGCLENRTRIILEIIKNIRDSINDDANFIVGLKLSSPNFEEGFREREFADFCAKLDESKLDYVVVAGGHYQYLQRITKLGDLSRCRETFYQQFAEMARHFLKNVRVIRCGGFVTAEQIHEVLEKKWADAVGIGRALAAEPDYITSDLANKLLNGVVLSAKQSIIPDNEFMKRKEAAGTQLWQIATGKKLLDLTDPKHVEIFEQELKKHEEHKKERKNTDDYGYMKLQL
uniref:Oxidored_FMN domain-containing protein n=1 Tax=Syphacia muris TaxID=451379 RepID=A0A0N5AXU7_9BILA